MSGVFTAVASVVYFVADVAAAREWYRRVLAREPYRDSPELVGFRLGAVDLCLHPRDDKAPGGAGGQVAYWDVTDLASAVDALRAAGARVLRAPLDAGEDGRVCQMVDPFGNVLGLRQVGAIAG